MPKKNTKKSDIIIAAAAAGVVVYSSVSMIRTHRSESKKRKQIRQDTELELLAIRDAALQVQENLEAGKYSYNNDGLVHLFEDLEFYRITKRPARPK